ncbi:hypothetical protein OROMI_002845 [Orobanche minor]
MEPKIFPLDAITPETKNWTAKVSVLNKTEPRTSSQPNSIRFQKLLLADNKENRVEAMLYRGDIELLKNSLHIHQTYLISNAAVHLVKPGFENPLTNNKYQLILGARTAILATDEDALIFSMNMQLLTKLNPFIITFWNDAAPDDVYNLISSTKERHIIAALNFSLTDYHSFVYTKRGLMCFNSRAMFLRRHKPISAMIPKLSHRLKRCLRSNRYDLLARGKLARTNQNFIYPCCAKCHRLTTAAYGRLFECHSCHEIKNAIPRFRFSLLVYDESSEIEVTVFGDEGEKIMQMSANDFMNKYCNVR